MTPNREMGPITIRTYEPGTDEYGAINQGNYTERTIEGVIKLYNQSNRIININTVNDPRYTLVTYVMLTKDFTLTDANTVMYNGKEYPILHLTPTAKYLVVLLGNG